MATGIAQVGTYSRLRIEANVVDSSAAGRWSDVSVQLYFEETSGSNNLAWNAGGVAASVSLNGSAIWNGSFGFDWRPGGLQSVLLYSGTTRINHNADGTPPSVTFGGSNGATGSSGGGGGGSVSVGVGLATLKVIPGVPTGVTATRVSDTQTTVSWAQSSASNGQPTTNTIQQSINGGAWADLVTVNATTSAVVSTAANRKTEYRVRGNNTAGSSAYSSSSSPIYTTPGAPTNVVATKQANLDIVVTFTENVDYNEYNHEVWHGVVAGGVTTWDGAALTTLASGVLSYTHVAPNAAQVHVYQVRSKSGSLLSAYSVSNSVQLLVAPNKPTLADLPNFADKAASLTVAWTHNSVDTTPQKFYEVNYSTDGGSSWTGTGKVTSTATTRVIAANTYAANAAVSVRVRTWGSATTGGSDGTGASAWSDIDLVTFKTKPTATITSPANSSVVNDGTLRATVGFSQPESASFVKAELELLQVATLLEALTSTNLVGITFATELQNSTSYTVRARVQDSNGLWSSWVSNAFSVTYLTPVPAVVSVSYLDESGYAQLDLTIAAPGAGQAAVSTVTITRTINGQKETVVLDYPSASALTFLDTTPTINGTNTYHITTVSSLGATNTVTRTLETNECRRAFLSKGAGFSDVVVFGGNLEVDESLSVASSVVQAAGRVRPIGLYGVESLVQLKASSFIYEGFGSTVDELREFLLRPGKACYRDASGRRLFGSVKGSVSYKKVGRGELSFNLTETS
jgi:hypothetical protein